MREENKKPILAICYDFDKTLTFDDMQAQGYIQKVARDQSDEHKVENFWTKSNTMADENDMDRGLAYMLLMKQEAEGKLLFTRDSLQKYGAGIRLFPGVETWFDRICDYGKQKGVTVEHYVISSGLKEMIEGTSIYNKFTRVYANSFYYDENGVAIWPAQVINATNKTQFLFRIKKGILDINDEKNLHRHFNPEDVRIPFQNIVYIGDSDTDIPSMKVVNMYGGYSIGVYNLDTKNKDKVYDILKDERIKFFAPTNYNENTEIDILVKSIIDQTKTREKLEKLHFNCKDEVMNHQAVNTEIKYSEIESEKREWIFELGVSPTFAYTHEVIKKLSCYDNWNDEEITKLIDIVKENTQVRYIVRDKDIKAFYEGLIEKLPDTDDRVQYLGELL